MALEPAGRPLNLVGGYDWGGMSGAGSVAGWVNQTMAP
jgi:hypothetical protein